MSYNYLPLDRKTINFQQIKNLLNYQQQVSITFDAHERILHCREFINNNEIEIPSLPVEHVLVPGEANFPLPILQLVLMLKIKYLSIGTSGIEIETVKRLLELFNKGVFPVVDVQHATSTAAIGEVLEGGGNVIFDQKLQPAGAVFALLGWQPLRLQQIEKAALNHGNQKCLAYALYTLQIAEQLLHAADVIALLSSTVTGSAASFQPEMYRLGSPYFKKAVSIRKYRPAGAAAATTTIVSPALPMHVAAGEALQHALSTVMLQVNSAFAGNVILADQQKTLQVQQMIAPVLQVMNGMQSSLVNLALLSSERSKELHANAAGDVDGSTNKSLNITGELLASSQKLLYNSCNPVNANSLLPWINGLQMLENFKQVLATEWLALNRHSLQGSAAVDQYREKYIDSPNQQSNMENAIDFLLKS